MQFVQLNLSIFTSRLVFVVCVFRINVRVLLLLKHSLAEHSWRHPEYVAVH